MLAKLPQGDLFANDAVYHKDCMSRYYNLHTSCLRKKRDDGRVNQSELEGIALAETVAYVVDDDSDGPFYIAELGELYKERLKQLGGIVPDRIHTPRFQERILSQIPWMRGQKDGNKLYIACEVTIGKAVVRDLHRSADQDACNMALTATLLREHILNSQPRFDGEFAFNAEETSVSQTLSAFVDMVLCGPSAIHNNSAEGRKMASLSIAQLMIYNAVRRTSTGQTATNVRHRIDRETPLAIYIALKVYVATEHSEEALNRLHDLGVCISYARVRDISKEMANSVIMMFEEGILCDRRISLRVKGKVYKTVVRPAMMYGAETWAVKKAHEKKLDVAEMRMLRWMSGVTKMDRIRNERIRGTTRVGEISKKVQESRLKWYGHVSRREEEYVGKRVLGMEVPGKRRRGRPKRRWMDNIRNDLSERGLSEEDAQDRSRWRRLTRHIDPT